MKSATLLTDNFFFFLRRFLKDIFVYNVLLLFFLNSDQRVYCSEKSVIKKCKSFFFFFL